MRYLLPLALAFAFGALGLSERTFAADNPTAIQWDKNLTVRISEVLEDCKSIVPGATRSALAKRFTTEGGLYTANHRTYVHQACPYIKIDVAFKTLSDDRLTENPADVIDTVSKPYLQYSIVD